MSKHSASNENMYWTELNSNRHTSASPVIYFGSVGIPLIPYDIRAVGKKNDSSSHQNIHVKQEKAAQTSKPKIILLFV